ncbi:chemotaxis protein CheA [Desulfobacterota bacterium M19]
MSSFISKEIVEEFIQEALTYIDEAREQISDDGCEPAGVNGVFRCLHTLKGTSGFLQLEELSRFVHRFEDFVRDKQEVGSGLNRREGKKVVEGLDLLETAVTKADNPDILAAAEYEDFLTTLHALAFAKAGYMQLDALVGQLKGLLGDDGGQKFPPDAFTPAIDAIKFLINKIIRQQKRVLLPVDYKTIDRIVLKGKDITAEVKLQLMAMEEVVMHGKAAFSNIDFAELVCAEGVLRENLSNGREMLGWQVISDVCEDSDEVVDEAFRHLWTEGVGKEAEITMSQSATATGVRKNGSSQAVGVDSDSAAPKEEFLRVKGSDLQELAVSSGNLVANRNNLENIFQDLNQYLPPLYRRHLKDSYAELDQSVNMLERRVSALNNKQLKDVLGQMPSIVQRLAHDLGKGIELTISGEQIEIPRGLVKALKDPLVHIVRNSCDHGIESPEERLAAGKPEAGKLIIAAERDDERLTMTIRDDGHGLDPVVIRRKAEEKGIISTTDNLTDEECQALIFEAGFSTNEEVSTVSGRGVGMDVVKNAIEPRGGIIKLDSTPGRGTSIQLIVPLNAGNSTRDVLLVQIADQVFGIDYHCLVEILKRDMVDDHDFKRDSFVNYRDTLIPMVDMASLLTNSCGADRLNNFRQVLVVEDEQKRRMCFGVHGIRHKVKVVVNGFEHDFLKNNTIFQGSAVLGAGQPCLVLNFKDVGKYL